MRIARAQSVDGEIVYGIITDEWFQPIAGSPFERELETMQPSGQPMALSSIRLLAPCQPSKIVCVGRNYADHAAEHGAEVPKEPLIFLKPPSAVVGPNDAIVLTSLSQQVEHEAELVAVVRVRARHLTRENALDCLLGYTCGNDVTARDLQRRDGQWSRAKGFDSFCPVGPCLVTGLDPRDLGVWARVNGEVRQDGRTSDLIFDVATLIEFVSGVMTLLPGDLIATGTPEGVGPLAHGDLVEVEVEGVGVLRNPVFDREDRRSR